RGAVVSAADSVYVALRARSDGGAGRTQTSRSVVGMEQTAVLVDERRPHFRLRAGRIGLPVRLKPHAPPLSPAEAAHYVITSPGARDRPTRRRGGALRAATPRRSARFAFRFRVAPLFDSFAPARHRLHAVSGLGARCV